MWLKECSRCTYFLFVGGTCEGDQRDDCKAVKAMGYCNIPQIRSFMAQQCCQTCQGKRSNNY